MADLWQTIEQAAVSLRLSVRTVNRHMAAGKLQSRLSPEGRREVLVSLPDSETPAAAAEPASPFADPAATDLPPILTDVPLAEPAPINEPAPALATASTSTVVDTESILALADSATQKADMAVTAYQTLARLADTQVRQVRRQSRFAWAAVALMAAGVTVAVGWVTHRQTRANADIERLRSDVASAAEIRRQLSDKSETVQARAMETERALRTELSAARESAVRAESRLLAYREQEADRQTREVLDAPSIVQPIDVNDLVSAMHASFKLDSDAPAGGQILYQTPATRPTTNPVASPSDTTSASTDTRN